ncbi:MAG: MarR family transcriptional regulator [Candidatus Omnitrophica bacterium]|nr:MarR family transcriptional regulator [Candidatus Omnitrophota bacterium]
MKDDDQLITCFRELQKKMPRFYIRELAKAKVTLPQYLLLSLIADSETMPMTEASAKLYITKPAITNLVDRLENHKFLKRIPHPTDRRVYLIQILPKGEKLVHQMRFSILELLLKAFKQFNAAERKSIARFYGLVSQLLDEALKPCEAGH